MKKSSKLIFILIVIFILMSLNPATTFAHPGNTASDGCHYCRTNCDRWGVPWNQRHCHGGGVVPPVQQTQQVIYPTSTPVPVRVYVTPTDLPTPTLIPSSTLTVTPTIKPIKTQAKIKKSVNKVNKATPTPTPKKNFWRWLFGF